MRRADFPFLGFGVGLRRSHYGYVVDAHPRMDWFELITENFMVDGGRPLEVLENIRERYPIVMHGVAMSLGSTDKLNREYLRALKGLVRRFEPAWISDHLCWTGVGGHNLHDLLPLPYTEEAVLHVASQIRHVQDFLGRPLLIENISSYITYRHSSLTEWDFLAAIAEEADCGILLDINNVFVNSFNHNYDAEQYIDSIPVDRVVQFHLAGHQHHGTHLLDTHDHPVCDEVWTLYERAVRRFGSASALIEWDDNIPDFSELQEAADEARRRHDSVLRATEIDRPYRQRSNAEKVTRTDHEFSLARLQQLLYRIVTTPGGAKEGPPKKPALPSDGIDSIIVADDRRSWRECIGIYAGAYLHRLLDVLKEDYPATFAVLGEADFEDLITDYLISYPPTEPSILYAGRFLPDFFRTHPLRNPWPFIADLARLELTTLEVFHARDAQPLDADALRTVAPDDWPALSIKVHPSVRILDLEWRVDTLLRAVENIDRWKEPECGPASIIVWRRGSQVHYRELEAGERSALVLTTNGANLAAICDAIVDEVGDSKSTAEMVNRLLTRWIADGLLTKP
jgi:uncharacterized protein (UPF0276 family)